MSACNRSGWTRAVRAWETAAGSAGTWPAGTSPFQDSR
jgi:hypothetical protein